MTTPSDTTTSPQLTFLDRLPEQIQVQPHSTVSSTALRAEGLRVVLFAFDAGEELSEHTAAVPAVLQVLSGQLQVTASGRTVNLEPGGLIHLPSRLPHAVVASEPSVMQLLLLDHRDPRTP